MDRHFSSPTRSPYVSIQWERRTSSILDRDGEVLFSKSNVEAPRSWSPLAVDIAVSKYFRKEQSVRRMIQRVVSTISEQGVKQKYFSRTEAKVFADELATLLLNQFGAFNSPVWFNVGVHTHPQCSACFILDCPDDLNSIFELAQTEARIFKFGSGTGTNFSRLRAEGEPLESGGHSSGVMSFLDVLDRGAGATKSGGTTRRAAKMVILDVDHPEISSFIHWKEREEQKAKALIRAGFSSGLDGEAYRTVSGQNSNNSVRIPDAFLRAVERGGEWNTRWRTNPRVRSAVSARTLWNQIAKAAWSCADPGIQFQDTINSWHTCPEGGAIRASNPCSEFMFLDNTSCNLASLNLVKFLKSDYSFDFSSFRQAVKIFLTAQEILVDYSTYPTNEVGRNSHQYRPLGLGYANLGGLIMRLGLPYDSDDARHLASRITAVMTGQAYLTSASLARRKGPFVGFKANKKHILKIVRRHAQAANRLKDSEIRDLWRTVVREGSKYGFRNSQVTVLAPTGTIGLLMDCDTTGIEPDFSLVKFKKLVGGGYLKMVNQSVPAALNRLGYNLSETEDILKFLEEESTIEGAPHLKSDHLPVFDCANRCGPKGVRSISPEGHLKMMAAVQPLLSGAISKTVNLPRTASVEDVQKIFLSAWKMGLKAIAIYRDGSKFTQPLTSGGGGWDDLLEASHIESPACSVCGHKTIRSGTCFRCLNCGHTDSCE